MRTLLIGLLFLLPSCSHYAPARECIALCKEQGLRILSYTDAAGCVCAQP